MTLPIAQYIHEEQTMTLVPRFSQLPTKTELTLHPGTALLLLDAELDLTVLEEGLEAYYDWLTTTEDGKKVHGGELQRCLALMNLLPQAGRG
jgi:hypothetical protein